MHKTTECNRKLLLDLTSTQPKPTGTLPRSKFTIPERFDLLRRDPKYTFLAEFGFLATQYGQTIPDAATACIEALVQACRRFREPPELLVERIVARLEHLPADGRLDLLTLVCPEGESVRQFTQKMQTLSPILALYARGQGEKRGGRHSPPTRRI